MRALLIGAVGLVGLVAALALMVGHDVTALLELDRAVGRALRAHGDGMVGVEVLQVLTAPGLTVFRIAVLLPVAILLAVRGRLRVTGFVVLSAFSIGLLTTLLKELVERARPTSDDPLVAADGLSFPSGHSSGAATLAGVLLVVAWPLVTRRWRPWLAGVLVIGALCVAWTRIALGVHYLSDTVAGLALGAAVVLVSMAVFGLYPHGPAELPRRGWPDRRAKAR